MLSLLLTACVLGYFPTPVPAQSPVQLSVYYESMCPDSDSFFHQQLAPTYEKLSEYMSVEIVPYGNAHYSGRRDTYRFTCQHGPEECYGNMVQACFVTLVNDTAEQIKFINCAFNCAHQRKSLEKCISDIDRRNQVKKCVTSPMGNNLLYQMGKKTDDLVPPHTFIPWITINGRGDRTLNDRANQDLKNVICNEFLSEKPEECKQSKKNFLRQFKNSYF